MEEHQRSPSVGLSVDNSHIVSSMSPHSTQDFTPLPKKTIREQYISQNRQVKWGWAEIRLAGKTP